MKPVAMMNTKLIKNRLGIPTMKDARIIVGDPIDFSDWSGQENDQKVLRWVTNEVMAAIQQMTGQTYVDVYASRVKRGDLKNADSTGFVLDHPNQGQPVPPRTADLAPETGTPTQAGM